MTNTLPTSSIDFFSDEAIKEPYALYHELRAMGPVVRLDQHDAWAVTRYDEARQATGDWENFTSAEGVSLTDFTNQTLRGTILASDPPLHDQLRSVVGERLTPRALRPMREQVQQVADELVEEVVAQGSFDAVIDLAQQLPLRIVPDFVGWPQEIHDKLLPWAAAGFDTMGPENQRCTHAMAARRELFEYAVGLWRSRNLRAGSLGAGVLTALDNGQIAPEQCPALLMDYLVPALDTTISAVGSAIWLFGRYPDQWDKVCADPTLIPNAFNEVVRIESPVRTFSRVTTRDVNLGGTVIPAGERVLLLWGSANRDERQFERPDEFDVTRVNANSHLAFGAGVHGCAGQGLARMEGHAMLAALASRVARFDIVSAAPVMNNVIRALASLSVTITPVP